MLEKTTIPEKHVPRVVTSIRELLQKIPSELDFVRELFPEDFIDSLALLSEKNDEGIQQAVKE